MSLITLKDLNGDHFLGTQEGETLINVQENVFVFSYDTPCAKNPLERVIFSTDQADFFVLLNYRAIVAVRVNNAQVVTDQEAAVIAYHRLLAVQEGLVSPYFKPENYFVGYHEVFVMEQKDVDKLSVDMPKVLSDTLTAIVQTDIAVTFVDRVSLVAFVFRSRGHHYMPAYEELYDRVWRKCRYDLAKLHISFQKLATCALHAIYPVILDNFWIKEISDSHVNGCLAKRVDGAPAGAAGPYVLRQGVEDLLMIAPGIKHRLEDAVHYLDEVEEKLAVHRFSGSVNSRYYNCKKVTFDEKRLGAIAATIIAAVEALTDDAPIGKSPALRRIASNAPITGAVLGRAIGAIANRPEVVNGLLLLEAPE